MEYFLIAGLSIWVLALYKKLKNIEDKLADISSDLMNFKMKLNAKKGSLSVNEQEFIPENSQSLKEHELSATPDSYSDYKKEQVKPFVVKDREIVTEDKEPSFIISLLTNYFSGGNLLVRIGGIVLFFGLAFLAKFAISQGLISIGLRVSALAAVAIVLILLGWKFRFKDGSYGQILQGLGVGVLYLTIYASAKFYTLLSLPTAFALMLIVVAIGIALAYLQNSLPLMLFATVGGFLVPILTSSGNGSHVLLFSYYLALNIGIFAMAWIKSWRVLNLVGFIFTYAIATTWGVLRYSHQLFDSVEPFLVAFFIIYLGTTILFTKKHTFEPKDYVDATLTFGTPLVTFMLQISLSANSSFVMQVTTILISTIYAILWFRLKEDDTTKLLAQSFLIISLIFATIAIPYLVSSFNINKELLTATIWAVEATGVLWLSLKQKSLVSTIIALVVLALSILLSIAQLNHLMSHFIHVYFIEITIVACSAFTSAYLLDKKYSHLFLPIAVASVALLLEIFTIAIYIGNTWGVKSQVSLAISIAILLVITIAIQIRTNWVNLAKILQFASVFWALEYIYFLYRSVNSIFYHNSLMLAMFIAIAIMQYYMLKIYKTIWSKVDAWHVATSLFILSVATIESVRLFSSLVYYIIPTLIALATILALNYFKLLPQIYATLMYPVLTALSAIWLLVSLSFMPKDYTPIVNSLELTQIVILVLFAIWSFTSLVYKKEKYIALSLLSLMFITTIVARVVAVNTGTEYTLANLINNATFELAVSIIWSVSGIIAMLASSKFKIRELWIGGFGILLAVVAKLFIIDMSNSGTIERIVSFIAVGVALLAIGYFVPMPPNKVENE